MVVLRLVRGLSISGMIRDSARRPVAGARVQAFFEIGTPDDDVIEKMILMIGLKDKAGTLRRRVRKNSE